MGSPGSTPPEIVDLLLEIATLDLLRTDARANLGDLRQRNHRRPAAPGATFVLGMTMFATSAAEVRIESGYIDHDVVLVSLRILPRVARCPANSGCSVAPIELNAEAGAPGLLSIDAHVELRNVALVARVGLGDAGDGAHRLEHAGRGDLEARHLRALHVDLDRLAAAAEDARLALNRRANVRDRAQLPAQVVSESSNETASLALRLEAHVDVAVVRRRRRTAAAAPTDSVNSTSGCLRRKSAISRPFAERVWRASSPAAFGSRR